MAVETGARPAVRVSALSEKYRVNFRTDGRDRMREFTVLKDLNFEIAKGEIVGLIGENGSGKTTLLKVLAGLLPPDGGQVRVDGSVSALIDIGAGLDPDFSGRENIAHALDLMRTKPAERERKTEEIIAFADLGEFIDASTKHYSSGMLLRLGFAISAHVDPDLLIVDEVISVGDSEFQKKCRERFSAFVQSGRTVIVVSHDVLRLAPLCSRMLLLKDGRVIADGKPDCVLETYAQTSGRKKSVAICRDEDGFEAVFNSGRVFLRHKDATLTPFSAYTWSSDFYRFRESSLDLDWTAASPAQGMIEASGTSRISGQKQKVTLRFRGRGRLGFDIETALERERSGSLRALERRCQLAPGRFARWFAPGPEDGVAGAPPAAMLDRALSAAAPGERRDFCAVGPNGKDGTFALFDSCPGSEQLEYEVIASEFENLAVRSFAREFPKDADVLEQKETIAFFDGREELVSALERIRAGTRFSRGGLGLVINRKQVSLALEGEEMLAGDGLVLSFFAPALGRAFFSFQARMRQIESEEKDRHGLNLTWDGLRDLSVDMFFAAGSGNGLGLEIVLNNGRNLSVRDFTLQFLFRPGARALNFGGVSRVPVADRNAALLFSDCYGPGFAIESGMGRSLAVSTGAKDVFWCFDTHKTDRPDSAALSAVAVANNIDSNQKMRRSFTVAAGRAPQTEENNALRLDAGRVGLVFRNGRADISRAGKQLTAGLGLYSSVFLQAEDGGRGAHWADSRHALWTLEEQSRTRLRLRGRWPWSDIEQVWTLALDEGGVDWAVDTRLDKEGLKAGALQMSLMLSDDYRLPARGCKEEDPPRLVHRDANLVWYELAAQTPGGQVGLRRRLPALFGKRRALPPVFFSLTDCAAGLWQGRVQKVGGLMNAKALVFQTAPDKQAHKGLVRGRIAFRA